MHGQCDARPTDTFPAKGHHCTATETKLYCLVTEVYVCERPAQHCNLAVEQLGQRCVHDIQLHKTVLPKVIWKETRQYPQVRECALPLHALAIQCAT